MHKEKLHICLIIPIGEDYIVVVVVGAELVDSVLDVVRKEAESTDCLQVDNKIQEILF